MRTSTLNTAVKVVTAGSAAVLLLGALAAQALAAPALSIQVDGSIRLIPTQIQYRATQTGITVSGWVVKQAERRGRIRGHVDITLVDAQGRPVAEYQAAFRRFSPSRKNPDRASFSTHIEPLDAGVTGLRVRYDAGGWPGHPLLLPAG